MRTTIDLEEDALIAVREIARLENASLGKVVSRLVRDALTGAAARQGGEAPVATLTGFEPFPPRGAVVSNALIDRLRDVEGV